MPWAEKEEDSSLPSSRTGVCILHMTLTGSGKEGKPSGGTVKEKVKTQK